MLQQGSQISCFRSVDNGILYIIRCVVQERFESVYTILEQGELFMVNQTSKTDVLSGVYNILVDDGNIG